MKIKLRISPVTVLYNKRAMNLKANMFEIAQISKELFLSKKLIL